MERTLSQDVKIDKLNLPKEWERHTELFRYWAEKHAISELEKDQAKEQLELVAADLDLMIRADPKGYNLDKIAESSVKSTIKMQVEHQEAQEVLNNAKYRVARMKAAKEAMDHRRDALKALSKLALGGFYAANTAPPIVKEEIIANRRKTAKKAFAKHQKTKQKRGLVT